MIENGPAITRGMICAYDDRKHPVKYVVVVSADYRKRDNFVSTMVLGDSYIGKDVVEASLPEPIGDRFIHCELVTYTRRAYLTPTEYIMPAEVMTQIDNKLSRGLGLNKLINDAAFYKAAYYELLDKMMGATNE